MCGVRIEPGPLAAQRGVGPTIQRVGVKRAGSYQGEELYALTVLPIEGPVPTSQELRAAQQAEAEKAIRESKEQTERALRR